jgi:lysozyme
MKRFFIVGVSSLLVQVSLARLAFNQSLDQTWKTLENEPSRSDLFKAAAQRHNTNAKPQVFVFPRSFLFPTDAEHDINGVKRVNSRFGIDISHHNGKDFPIRFLHRQGVAFVYIKATQGVDFADKTFPERLAAIKALPGSERIPYGPYHFLSSDESMSGADQADRLLAYLTLHGGLQDGDLRPAVDLEWDKSCLTCPDRWSNRSAEELLRTLVDFINRVHKTTGWTPFIYTNVGFLSDRGLNAAQINLLVHAGRIWIFDLADKDLISEVANPTKNLPYLLWQFSWTGRLSNGYSGEVDVDSFKGTDAEFNATFLTKN